MVDTVLRLIKAERTGNWNLHLSAVAAMTPHFVAMDRPNYSRWLPKIPYRHAYPGIHTSSGTSSIPSVALLSLFSQVSPDMALEQSLNADSKAKGGIIRISQTKLALDRWFLTIHDRPSVTTALKEVYGIKGNDTTMHKEATKAKVKRDEDDVNKLVERFTSDLMTNPFSLESDAVDKFATGVVLLDDLAERWVNSTSKGRDQMKNFIEKRINSNITSFWDAIPSNKGENLSVLCQRTFL